MDAVHTYLLKIKKSHREINLMVISDPSVSHNCIKIYAFYFWKYPPGSTSSASNDQSQPAAPCSTVWWGTRAILLTEGKWGCPCQQVEGEKTLKVAGVIGEKKWGQECHQPRGGWQESGQKNSKESHDATGAATELFVPRAGAGWSLDWVKRGFAPDI